MTTVRSAKSKGSQFEYDCQYSLTAIYPDIYRTSERGFQMQYDLRSDYSGGGGIIIECKRLKSMSWNQAVKFFKKLITKIPDYDYGAVLIFKSNQQPCLVMSESVNYGIIVNTFEDYFNVPFLKHPSTRAKK